MKTAPVVSDLYGGRNPREISIYSAGEAARYLRIPENTIRSWISGRAYPAHWLSFVDLLDLYVVGALRRQQHANIRRQGQGTVLDAHLKRIERDEHGLAIRLFPFTRKTTNDAPRIIAIDPLVAFGRPVIAGSRIPTSDIADRFKAGESPSDLAYDYGRAQAEIEEAIRCELGAAA